MTDICTREAFLEKADFNYAEVEIEPYGKLRIRDLNAGERDTFETLALAAQQNISKAVEDQMRSKLIAMCLVDADGKNFFDHTKEEDLKKIKAKAAAPMLKLFDACVDHIKIKSPGKDSEGAPGSSPSTK
jgi:hypothetical protein